MRNLTLALLLRFAAAGCGDEDEKECIADWQTGCKAGGLDLDGPHCCSGRCVELGDLDYCEGRDSEDAGPDAAS